MKNIVKISILSVLFCLAFMSGLKAQNIAGTVSTDSARNATPKILYVPPVEPTASPKQPDTVWASPKAHFAKIHNLKSRHPQTMKADSANQTKTPANKPSSPQNSGTPK